MPMPAVYSSAKKVVIIGGGPAGMSCALWLRQYGIASLIIDVNAALGGAMLVSRHSNKWVLGQEHCTGVEIGQRFADHVLREGIEVRLSTAVEKITPTSEGFSLILNTQETHVSASHVVLCVGLRTVGREVFQGLNGLAEVEAAGAITFGQATPAQHGQLGGAPVVVLGGGDNALETALDFSAKGGHVTLVMRGEQPRAHKKFSDAVAQKEREGSITVIRNAVVAGFGHRQGTVTVELAGKNVVEGAHIFVLYGYRADTGWIRQQLPSLAMDADGIVTVDEWMQTSVPGVFAAGDIITPHHPSVVSAVASGSMAARGIERA